MRASELIGAHAVASDGRSLGRIFDLIIAPDESLSGREPVEIVGLVVGRRGALERIGLPRRIALEKQEPGPDPCHIPWVAVRDIEEGCVTVDEGKIGEEPR